MEFKFSVNKVGNGSLSVDGVDLSKCVSKVDITASADDRPEVTLRLAPSAIVSAVAVDQLLVRAEVELDSPTVSALKLQLRVIEMNDQNYETRNKLVMTAVAMAMWLGYEAGFRIDPAEPEWPVAFIQLPTGQVSWHLPQFQTGWDGHSTDEKYQRVNEFIRGNAGVAQ